MEDRIRTGAGQQRGRLYSNVVLQSLGQPSGRSKNPYGKSEPSHKGLNALYPAMTCHWVWAFLGKARRFSGSWRSWELQAPPTSLPAAKTHSSLKEGLSYTCQHSPQSTLVTAQIHSHHFLNFYLFIYLLWLCWVFVAALPLSSCGKWRLHFAVCVGFVAVASLVAGRASRHVGFSSPGTHLGCLKVWDLPVTGMEPMFPQHQRKILNHSEPPKILTSSVCPRTGLPGFQWVLLGKRR